MGCPPAPAQNHRPRGGRAGQRHRRWHKPIYVAAVLLLVRHVHGLSATACTDSSTSEAPYQVSELLETLHRISTTTPDASGRALNKPRRVPDASGRALNKPRRVRSSHGQFTDTPQLDTESMAKSIFAPHEDPGSRTLRGYVVPATAVCLLAGITMLLFHCRTCRKTPTDEGWQHPEVFYCPITAETMKDPVIDPEGNSYERAAIEEWLARNATSPVTRAPLRACQLVPNRGLKCAIERTNNHSITQTNT